MMAGFIVFVLGRSGMEGPLRAGAGCCSAYSLSCSRFYTLSDQARSQANAVSHRGSGVQLPLLPAVPPPGSLFI